MVLLNHWNGYQLNTLNLTPKIFLSLNQFRLIIWNNLYRLTNSDVGAGDAAVSHMKFSWAKFRRKIGAKVIKIWVNLIRFGQNQNLTFQKHSIYYGYGNKQHSRHQFTSLIIKKCLQFKHFVFQCPHVTLGLARVCNIIDTHCLLFSLF